MKHISGLVLVKETNSGVPNLIVTAYDSERSIREVVGERAHKQLCLEDLGRRIGSVLTDQNGAFSVKSEHLEFQGNESRPNLSLVIFAPEDVQDLKTPYPLPPEDRILYISTVAREDAGAEEAFVIRLLQKQLEHFQVSSAVSNESNLDDTRLATAMERTWDFKDRLKDRLKTRLREEQERNDEFQREAQKKVEHLYAIPKHLQNDGLINSRLLIKGKRELADNLKPAQDQVVGRGLERLKTRKTLLRLRLPQSKLKDLGLTMQEGKLVGTINTEQLSETVRAVINGFDLVRKRGLNNPTPEALIKKYLLATPVSRTGKDEQR